MKKASLLVLISILSYSSFACDICGCAGMTVGFGNLSFFNQHQVGVRYSLRQFNSPLGSDDYFHQIDLNGSYVLNDRFILSASLPYLSAQRTSVEVGNTSVAGAGDATVKVTYFPWRYGGEVWSSRLGLNFGLNLPTGNFVDRDGSLIPQNFQIGTGSLDYLFEAEWQVGKGNWVGLVQGRYLVNTLNTDAYKFGNQAGLQFTAAYKIERTKIVLVPLLNFSIEHFDRDVNNRGYYQFGTGGDSFNVLAGLQVKAKDWLWSVRGGTNLSQTGDSEYIPGVQIYLSTSYLF